MWTQAKAAAKEEESSDAPQKAPAKEAESSEAPQKAPASPVNQTDAAPVPVPTVGSKRAADTTTDTAEVPPKAKKAKKQRKTDAAPQPGQDTVSADVLATESRAVPSQQQTLDKVKWKKLAQKALREHNGAMTLSELQVAVSLAAHVPEQSTAEANASVANSADAATSQFTHLSVSAASLQMSSLDVSNES